MQHWSYATLKHTQFGLILLQYDADGVTHLEEQLHNDHTRTDPGYVTSYQNALLSLASLGWEPINAVPVDDIYDNWYFKLLKTQ